MVDYLLAEVMHAERLAAIEAARRETEIRRFVRRAKHSPLHGETTTTGHDPRLAREVT